MMSPLAERPDKEEMFPAFTDEMALVSHVSFHNEIIFKRLWTKFSKIQLYLIANDIDVTPTV